MSIEELLKQKPTLSDILEYIEAEAQERAAAQTPEGVC